MDEADVVARGCRYLPRWARQLPAPPLALSEGAALRLTGPNGAGKSTYLRALANIVPARWEERHCGPDAWTQVLGSGGLRYVGIAGSLASDVSLQAHAAWQAHRLGKSAPHGSVDDALRAWHLDDPDTGPSLEATGSALSAGQAQAASLAIALAGRPRVVLLDEPATSLDQQRRTLLVERLAVLMSSGTTLLFVTHDDGFASALGSHRDLRIGS